MLYCLPWVHLVSQDRSQPSGDSFEICQVAWSHWYSFSLSDCFARYRYWLDHLACSSQSILCTVFAPHCRPGSSSDSSPGPQVSCFSRPVGSPPMLWRRSWARLKTPWSTVTCWTAQMHGVLETPYDDRYYNAALSSHCRTVNADCSRFATVWRRQCLSASSESHSSQYFASGAHEACSCSNSWLHRRICLARCCGAY